ncbi:N-glycosylation protein-domain-containing protein [Coniella lustricola]|uniref:N-glycosylation protein-domain-containing protein n=1 Tax=Coniella lustricola TaxID=2025994 RepID=A0A2T2ZRY7_9PEZI|nr:N-glycosylation protein-domain-containing protein [Coniella lustricola]
MSALTRSRTWSTVAHPEEPRERRNTLPSAPNSPSPSDPSTATATVTTPPRATATLDKKRKSSTVIHASANAHLPPTPPNGSPQPPPPANKKKSVLPDAGESVVAPSFLQPRVAAILGVEKRWQPVLFSLRLLSIFPAIILGFPLAIRCLLMLHAFATKDGGMPTDIEVIDRSNERLLLTELMLAMIWCGSSGYLSFYFTDYLMSRWLINYTPSATALRLVSISALNGYLQSWTLHLSGSSHDPFLLLPTWVIITSTLTLVYHFTYRKINIRKETSTSISVFSMASYISMVALLIQQHWDRTDWLELPFIALGCRILRNGGDVVIRVAKYTNITVTP